MAGARYTKWIASLELRHKEHDNDPYPLHNKLHTIERDNTAYIDLVYRASPAADDLQILHRLWEPLTKNGNPNTTA